MNSVFITGRLVADPELSKGGVASFSLACTAGKNKVTGAYVSCFYRCVAYKLVAEKVAKTLRKGMLVDIEGYLNQRKYTDKNNMHREIVEIVIRAASPVITSVFADPISGHDTTKRTDFGNPANANVEESESGNNIEQFAVDNEDLPF